MRRAFTLIELLTVITLMSMLGVASVVAGLSVARHFADRSAREALVGFVRLAGQVALQDGVRTVLRFRTQEISENDEHVAEFFCRAVAVRASGRISRIIDGRPWDEFADEGAVCLDGRTDVFPMTGGETATWTVGAAYGTAFATLELPKGYLVDDGTIVFQPMADGSLQMSASVQLKVRRSDGTDEAVGAAIAGIDGEDDR